MSENRITSTLYGPANDSKLETEPHHFSLPETEPHHVAPQHMYVPSVFREPHNFDVLHFQEWIMKLAIHFTQYLGAALLAPEQAKDAAPAPTTFEWRI
jgi:hypothetical protein